MRSWVIMGSAAGIALVIAFLITSDSVIRVYREYKYGGDVIVLPSPHHKPMRTTVEQPGGFGNPDRDAWDYTSVAVLTAPKTMPVDDTAEVETILLVSAGQKETASLLQAAKDAKTAIDAGSQTQ